MRKKEQDVQRLRFNEFELSDQILKGIKEVGFEEASPIQEESIRPLLSGQDVIGQAQTGTGKTAAFGIPMLEMVTKEKYVQGLILCPTRELSIQVADELMKLGKYKKGLNILPVYGGSSMERQLRALKKGVQIVVGTPGRVMDHMRRRSLDLSQLKMVVLDEADEMFDMGFRDDMKTILDGTNEERQTCFFSATMGKEIMDFSKMYQRDPAVIRIKHKELTVENITQYYLEMTAPMKTEILSRLVDIYNPELTIVFCNTKRRVDDLVAELTARGFSADGLHGDLKQTQRDTVMKKFRQSTIDILVATDVAARGIDVGNVDVVVNYDLPQDEEYYVHRIGRTARAGRRGRAFTFVVGRDVYKLQDIIRYTKADMQYMELPTISDITATFEEKLIDSIQKELSKEEDLSKYRASIDKLLLQEYGAVEVASVLLKMLADTQGLRTHKELDQVDFGKKYRLSRSGKNGKKGGKGRGKGRNDRRPRVFINKGKRDGLDPKSILSAFHKETNIPKKAIGNILIKDNFTFVELPEEFLKTAAKKLSGKKIRGKKVHVEISENRGRL
ncbi:DEAD/DEAH box helicase [Peptoniphilus sp. KCTC 25270]|nr:DEAD/DEAH box helicase [Peptoniphilus sp. KCTC 25270]MCD1147782.1 DEAD/DEAH box helicase [Peptoniphilus sp. KCTC 25270]